MAVKGTQSGFSWAEIEEEQKHDTSIRPVYLAEWNNKKPSPAVLHKMDTKPKQLTKQHRCLSLQRGVLFWSIIDPRDEEEIRQLVVPKSLQRRVYESQHKHSGHFVKQSTLELMR